MLGLWLMQDNIPWQVYISDRLLECVRFDGRQVILYIAISFRERAVKDTKIRGLFQKNSALLT
jgi:hypothetical protein